MPTVSGLEAWRTGRIGSSLGSVRGYGLARNAGVDLVAALAPLGGGVLVERGHDFELRRPPEALWVTPGPERFIYKRVLWTF